MMVVKIEKQKTQKWCHKELVEDYKNCLEAAQIGNKINHLEKNKINMNIHNEFTKKNKCILKTPHKFRREKHNVVTEEINKIALRWNDDNRIQSINFIETCAYEMSIELVCKKEETKCNNMIKQYKMFNFDYITKEDLKEHSSNWAEIPDYP